MLATSHSHKEDKRSEERGRETETERETIFQLSDQKFEHMMIIDDKRPNDGAHMHTVVVVEVRDRMKKEARKMCK